MKTLTTLACLAMLAVASGASAQQKTWDVAGQLSLLNRNRPQISDWDNWYSVGAATGTVGHYWTTHFKTEFEIGTAAQGTVDGYEPLPAPGTTNVLYPRYREHRFNETSVSAIASYQFFDNQWVHPFVGAGVELVRARHRADALRAESPRIGPSGTPLSLPAVPAIDNVTYAGRPLVTGGVKLYVSPNAFVRFDARTSFSSDRPVSWQWRGGIGFDF